jgi:hypothetical protein
MFLFLLTGMPLHAQQDQISAGVQAEVKTPAVTAGDAAPARPLSPGDAREDLTVFFTIGVVVDVLLVTAFLVWAVGQWRKPRK